VADRESCVAQLASVLSGISIANGYEIDLGRPVRRSLFTMEELNDAEFDSLIVEDSGEAGKEVISRYDDPFVHVSFSVAVIGYAIRRASDPTVTTAINRLDRAIKKAIYQHEQIDGVWIRARAMPLMARSGSEGVDYGYLIRPVQINYDGLKSEGF